jgi:hypothetical protein
MRDGFRGFAEGLGGAPTALKSRLLFNSGRKGSLFNFDGLLSGQKILVPINYL